MTLLRNLFALFDFVWTLACPVAMPCPSLTLACCPALPCPVLSHLVLPCPVISSLVSDHNLLSCCIMPRDISMPDGSWTVRCQIIGTPTPNHDISTPNHGIPIPRSMPDHAPCDAKSWLRRQIIASRCQTIAVRCQIMHLSMPNHRCQKP